MSDITDKKMAKIKALIDEVDQLIVAIKAAEAVQKDTIEAVHEDNRISAKNLVHYRSLRSFNVSSLQKKLGNLGLSRLEKTQTTVLASLQSTRSLLESFLGTAPSPIRSGLSFKAANRLSKKNVKSLLGYRSKGRHARIMVTIPSEAADNYQLVEDMLANGMNCARINCAHDNQEVWLKMIDNIKKASQKLHKKCKIAMDLAGPKIRTGALLAGPKIQKLKVAKNLRGQIKKPLLFEIGKLKTPDSKLTFIPIDAEGFEKIQLDDHLAFKDTRGKNRSIHILEKTANGFLASMDKTSYLETGMSLYVNRTDEHIIVGELDAVPIPIILKTGDLLRIDRHPIIGEAARHEHATNCNIHAHIACTAPQVFDEVKIGEAILFDDGKISGIIKDIQEDYALVEIVKAATQGSKLRADKGINLPNSDLSISGLTAKDKQDLKFVVAHADLLNMSFVNSVKDVQELLAHLELLEAKKELGIVLKIETQKGFNQLTDILLEALKWRAIGVMIARGDLAIEIGWMHIGRVQQEILSLCEAAHITDIWATQVLESLAKKGLPSRAEITDVIKAQQADCVMLNKGPHIIEAIHFLDRVLKEMQPYREKSVRLAPAMDLMS